MAQITSNDFEPCEDTAEPPKTKLSVFVHDLCDKHPDFAFSRHWYKGKENRVGVGPWLDKKLFPGDKSRLGCAAKYDLLLPPMAPGDLGRYGTLVDRFDDTLPPYEQHAMAHVKIMLDPAEAWHVGFERVRSYARVHFAHRFAVVLIAHIPGLFGLKGQGNHIHCAVLSREITINGFGGACTDRCMGRPQGELGRCCMSGDQKAKPSEVLAAHFALKGEHAVAELQATVERAREMLTSDEVQPYAEGENPLEVPPYDWEVSEPNSDAPRRIYLGSVSDLATGQGRTVHFAAGLARYEDEVRRQLAGHIGHVLANGAKVNRGVEEAPFSKTFISPSLRETLEKFDQGRDAPAAFFYLSRWHENRG